MIKKSFKELFAKEKYQEVIDELKIKYIELFQKMLDVKKIEYDKKNNYIEYYISKIDSTYKELDDYTVLISNTLLNPDGSYLETINILIDCYDFFNYEYKNIKNKKTK